MSDIFFEETGSLETEKKPIGWYWVKCFVFCFTIYRHASVMLNKECLPVYQNV